jgi:CheY-like chemotaxis protein
MNNKRFPLKSILIVDDEEESLELYSSLLKKKFNASIKCTKFPSEAIMLANEHLYDIILIDVTMIFHDTQLGGFEVYKNLLNRYGNSSLLVYSQKVTDSWLRDKHYNFNFIEKKVDPGKFINEVAKKMIALRRKQSCFIAMPFSQKHDKIYKAIKDSMKGTFYCCQRIDKQLFNKSIVQKIFSEIQESKLIIFLATDQNPNAFYECGYAVALNKEVITLTDDFSNLPFDIKDRNSIEYKNNLDWLMKQLNNKLHKLTNV